MVTQRSQWPQVHLKQSERALLHVILRAYSLSRSNSANSSQNDQSNFHLTEVKRALIYQLQSSFRHREARDRQSKTLERLQRNLRFKRFDRVNRKSKQQRKLDKDDAQLPRACRSKLRRDGASESFLL